jgi:hypothetical protein
MKTFNKAERLERPRDIQIKIINNNKCNHKRNLFYDKGDAFELKIDELVNDD